MKALLVGLFLLVSLVVLAGDRDQPAQAGKKLKSFTKTSVVAQADQAGVLAEDFTITSAAAPYTFAKVGKIRKITQIRITLTLTDGTTAPGTHDEDDLTLALDGIDTGLRLNGFDEVEEDTRTVSGKPINESQLRAALKADGTLAATIIDADPGDNLISSSSADVTTLVLKGKQKR
jgi:hypothetical protein